MPSVIAIAVEMYEQRRVDMDASLVSRVYDEDKATRFRSSLEPRDWVDLKVRSTYK